MKKIFNLTLALAVGVSTLSSCKDDFMEWGTPDGHNAVTSAELPLAVKEAIANYDNIKVYAADYTSSSFKLGLGAGADLYVSNETYNTLANDNFQMITLGNAMKMDAVVTNSGGLNFTTVDAFLDAKPADVYLYGHNFIWHTQQKQDYLKSLIKPTQVIESDGDIQNMLSGDDCDFEGGTKGSWGSWGNSSSTDVVSPGAAGSNYCLHLMNPTDANFWSAQCAYTFSEVITPGTYKLRFKGKSANAGGQVQFQYQNGTTYGSQGGYTTFDLTTDWATYEADIEVTPEDANRIIFNFGQIAGDFYIDDIQFGLPQEKPTMTNLLTGDSYDFENSKGAWGSWGNSSSSEQTSPGYGGSNGCLHLSNPSDADFWSAQCAYTFTDNLAVGSYKLRFKGKTANAGGQVQFQYQNGTTYGSQGGYTTIDLTTSWATYEYDIEVTPEDVNRIIFNFGKVAGDFYLDEVEFGPGISPDPMVNVLVGDDSDFEGGSLGTWGSWGNSSSSEVASPGHESDYCMHLNNPSDGSDYYVAQAALTFDEPLVNGETYILQFYAKAGGAGQSVQFCYQNSSTYSGGGYSAYDLTTDWTLIEHEFTLSADDMDRILINFGKVAGDYYIDDVKFGVKTSSAKVDALRHGKKNGTKIYYVLKSAAEKKAAMEGAMENWIKGMAEHLAEKSVTPVGYDVINEPIMDGSNLLRGVDAGVFNGEDTEPVETEADGLTLNWEDGHWYWGYYMGKEYGVKAFQFARKYLPTETKLFINDYNLETSPSKLAALIQFVKDIDAANGTPIVDGIGTQMHLTLDISEDDDLNTQIDNFIAKVEAALQTLKETGKLVRITELDIALGTATPSSYQLEAQYWAYRKIFEKYLEIIPESQQSGITIWTLSDNEKEHEYWLPDESPNLWDKDYLRKWAYKGVCDGLAGEDLGLKFTGDDYKAWYEKNNTGDF